MKKRKRDRELKLNPDLVIQMIEEFLQKNKLITHRADETVVINGVDWSDAPFVIDYSLKKGGV